MPEKIPPLDIAGVEDLTPLEMNAIHFETGAHSLIEASAPAAPAPKPRITSLSALRPK